MGPGLSPGEGPDYGMTTIFMMMPQEVKPTHHPPPTICEKEITA